MMKYVLLNMDGNALMDIAVYTNAKTQKLRQCADVEEKLRSQRLWCRVSEFGGSLFSILRLSLMRAIRRLYCTTDEEALI